MAVADYGDIGGHSVNVGTWLDDLCSSDGGQAAAQTIVADESVVGVLGTSCSGAATAAAPLITGAGMVLVSGSNTSPALTSDLAGTAGDNYSTGYYRTAHNDLYQGAAAAKFAVEVLGISSAAAIHDGDPYTEGLATAFADAFAALGGDVTAVTAVNKGDTDMIPVLTEVAAGSPEMLFFPIFMPEGGFIVQQVGEVSGLGGAVLMGADGLISENFMALPESEGVFMSGPDLDFAGNSNQATGQTGDGFLAAYEAEHGETPAAPFWGHAYDATTMLLDAISAASYDDGGTLVIDRAGVREYLNSISGYSGIIGVLTCDDFGDCGSQRISVIQHNDSSDWQAGTANVVFTYNPTSSAQVGDIAAAAADSADAIKLPIHNWSSQIAGVYVVGSILESNGNSVEYISADSTLVYTAMCEGDMDLVHEVWQGAFGPAFEPRVEEGCVIDAATHDALTREEWWYPTYVEDVCPGLPDWEALNDCAELFATPDSGGKGRFLGGPADWLKGDQERVEGLGMDFIVENAGTAGALWSALEAASANNEPIVLFNWTPNFIEAMYDGKFIEFPTFADECRTDASWGINPETTHDCGNPKDGYLKLGVWSGFPDKWPTAYAAVQKMNFTNLDVAQLAMYVDIDGMEPEDAAALWLADNCARWTGWSGADASVCPDAPEAPAAAGPDSTDPIKLPIHNWSSQIAGVYAIGAILESTGNSVEYISADSTLVYTSMCEGDMDLVHEVWQGAFGVAFEEQVDAGCVIDAATHDAKTREEWWYPSYVEDVCPGLPDWEALNACAEMFATPDSGGKGRFLGGPVDWLKGDQERVEGLEMDFIVENAGTAGALWAALEAASANNEPIVLFNWTPNFIEAMYDGKFIEFPTFADVCRTDASWGMNPETTHDCGNPKDGYLKLGVWEGFPAKWPNAYAAVQNMNFSNLDIAQLAMYVDIDGMEPEDAAALWLAENCARWTGWSGADASVCPAAPEAPAAAVDSSDPIKLPIHNWSSQIAGVYAVGAILESTGNSVEYISADSTLVYTSMCEGDMDLVHEVWEGAFGVAFMEQVDAGCVIDAATHDAKTREEWWYPSYVEDVCPGLPDWEALTACAAMFATPDSGGKGRFLGGPVDWLKGDQERVEGLEMDFIVENAGTAGALWAALEAASANQEPIVLFNWTPNFIEAMYDGKFIEFPTFADECRTDASWGLNPETTHDCGNPKDGYLKLGGWEGFPAKWPNAYAAVQKMNFTNLDIAQLAMYVDIDGMEPEDAAALWLAENCARWTGWSGADASVCPAAPEAPAAAVDSSDAIKLPIHNWSSQIAGVYAVGAILEATGNSVEYISADSTLVYTSMCEGDMDLVHEVWEGAFGVAFMEQVDAGCVIDAATHDAKTREEWWYPSYIEDVCPGLPDWEALNDCAAMFATPDSGGKGRFLGGPVDWLKGDQERVEGLGMDFIVENAGTAGALWAALEAASANQEPIVLFNWTPNFIEAMYDGKFIEFPTFADECRTDASWGLNPETTHDCGNPKDGYLKLGVWSGFPDKWPTAYAAVQKMNFTNLDIAQLAMYVDIDGMEPEDAAALWLADNCARWTGWASADQSVCPAAPEAPAAAVDSSDPIKLPIHNWSSQIAGVYAVGTILESTGNSVEYISADSTLVYTSMCEGDMDLVHEVWEGAFGVAFMEQVDAGV